MRTALLAWSALSFCFRSSRSMPLTLFSLRTKRCSQSLHLTIGRKKSVADCGNFWRSLAFSSVRALRGLPLHDQRLAVPRNFLNSLLTSRFVHLFSGNSPVNLFPVYPFKFKLLIKILSSSLIDCWHTLQCRLRWRISDATNWSPKVSKRTVTWTRFAI